MTDTTDNQEQLPVSIGASKVPDFETVADIFVRRMSDLSLTTQDVATALSFQSPNVVSMIRSRKMRLPVNRLFLASKRLEVDPVYMLRCMGEEMKRDSDDDRLLEVMTIMMGQEPLTAGEMNLIKMVRKQTHNREFDLEKDFPEEWGLIEMAMEDVGKKVERNVEAYSKIRKRRGPAPGTTRKKVSIDIANPGVTVNADTPEKALERAVADPAPAPAKTEEEELRELIRRKQNAG